MQKYQQGDAWQRMPYCHIKCLVSNYGPGGGGGGLELQNGREEACKVLSLRKRGVEKVLAMLKGAGGGGGTTSCGVLIRQKLEVLTILKGGGGAKGFHFLKGGGREVYPVLRDGGATSFGPAIFPFCRPPPPSP